MSRKKVSLIIRTEDTIECTQFVADLFDLLLQSD